MEVIVGIVSKGAAKTVVQAEASVAVGDDMFISIGT